MKKNSKSQPAKPQPRAGRPQTQAARNGDTSQVERLSRGGPNRHRRQQANKTAEKAHQGFPHHSLQVKRLWKSESRAEEIALPSGG